MYYHGVMASSPRNHTHDPLTGKPWKLCSPIVITAREQVAGTYARCRGCGRPVAPDRTGRWDYVDTNSAAA